MKLTKIVQQTFSVIIILLLVTGCSQKTESGTTVDSKTDTSNSRGTLLCTRTATAQNNATVSLNYEVSYNKGYITKLHSIEKLNSTDKATLDMYENAYKNLFKVYEGLQYYNNTITRESDSITCDTVIEYDKIDMDALAKIEDSEYSVIKDGKVALNDWLKFAENFGTKCSEK